MARPFQMVLSATGVAAGTYSTTVVITDNSSGNKTVTIPVTLTVQSASPVLQLVPASLTFQAGATAANPGAAVRYGQQLRPPARCPGRRWRTRMSPG